MLICVFLKVLQCRKLLFEMSHISYEEIDPPERPSGWKKTCSLLLTQKVILPPYEINIIVNAINHCTVLYSCVYFQGREGF